MPTHLPKRGKDWATLEAALDAMAESDIDWRRGRTPLYVFHANDSVSEVARQAYMKFFTENALGARRAFFSLQRMEREIVEMALGLLHAPEDAAGTLTTGGSESIFLAVKACRDRARAERGALEHPNIVAPYSAHPAFNKAGHVMDIEIRRVPTRADLRADPKAMAQAVDERTIMLVGSAPCFPHGTIDEIAAIGEVAGNHGAWLHVDACVGGYVAPFARMLGRPIPDFDFTVPAVRSISADLHKFGYCPKPASTILYRSAEDHGFQVFDLDVWPNGRFTTATLAGTRPGGAVAAAWAVMNHLGENGYLEVTAQLLETVRAYRDGIEAIPGLFIWGDPDLSIISFGSEEVDIYAVAEGLTARGWLVGLTREPKGIHIMMSMLHAPVREEYLDHLRQAVAEVRAGRAASAKVEVTY